MESNFKLINDWLVSLDLKKNKEPKQEDIHVDSLIHKPVGRMKQKEKKPLFFRSLELFYDLIHLDFGYNLHEKYVLSLYFRLEFSKKISLRLKHGNIWEELEDSPPNIYLIPKKYFLLAEEIEEYKKPLDLPVFKKFQTDCVVYYRCFRDMRDIQNNWEYARAIDIECRGKC